MSDQTVTHPRSTSVPAPQTPFARSSAKRSLILAAIGSVAGLALAGYSLFTADGTRIASVPPEDVALVNGRPILTTDFEAQLQSLFSISLSQSTTAQRRKVLNDMIREELFVQRGLALDMSGVDPDVRSTLVAAVEQQLAADVTTRQPSDAQLEKYYERHRDKYSSEGTVTLRDLIAPHGTTLSPHSAQQAVQALRHHVPLETVTMQYGLVDSGQVHGEEFYFAARIHLRDALFEAARTLPDGGVSDPIAAPDGTHILVMEKNVRPVPMAFAQTRDTVLRDYWMEEVARIQRDEEEYLRKRADIQIAAAYQR